MTFWTGGMMAAAARGGGLPVRVASSTASATIANTLTVDKPSGTRTGDFMVAFVWGSGLPSATMTGWTQVFIDTAGTIDLAVLTKTAGGSEPSSYSLVETNATRSCVMATYRGGAGAIDVQSTTTNQTIDAVATALSITPTKPGLLLASFGLRTTGTVSSAPSGMSYVNGIVGVAAVSTALYELSPSSAGATGNKSLTWSTSSNSGGWMAQIY